MTRPTPTDAVRNLDAYTRNLLDTIVDDLDRFHYDHPEVGPADLAQFVLLVLCHGRDDARQTPTGQIFDLVRDGNGFMTRFVVRNQPTD